MIASKYIESEGKNMTKAMKKIGYMIVKIGKRGITVCLFNESEEDLKWACDACAFKELRLFLVLKMKTATNTFQKKIEC